MRRTDILKPSEFAVAKYSGPGIASNVVVSSCLKPVIGYGGQKESSEWTYIEAKSPTLLNIICIDITIHIERGMPSPSYVKLMDHMTGNNIVAKR